MWGRGCHTSLVIVCFGKGHSMKEQSMVERQRHTFGSRPARLLDLGYLGAIRASRELDGQTAFRSRRGCLCGHSAYDAGSTDSRRTGLDPGRLLLLSAVPRRNGRNRAIGGRSLRVIWRVEPGVQ
jgi:hypothetical protein